MAIFEKDMNVESQLQVAFSTIAELRDQNEVLNKTIWSLEERLRMSEEGREDLKRFYENQMDALRADQQKLIEAAVSRITESFEAQMAKLTSERDAAVLSAKSWRCKKYGRKSERNAGHDDTGRGNNAGENRESEKADYVNSDTQSKKHGKRSACMVHIRRGFVDAILENRIEAMWFIDEIGKLFAMEHRYMKQGLTGTSRLLERLKKGSTADIMFRIEERPEVFRKSGYAGCGEMLTKALRYAGGEWPAMKRVLENGDVELSNNLSEQMMRSIKMNLKNAGNIGSEDSARHNAFMFSVIESCRMCGRSVEKYLTGLLERLKTARDGDALTYCLPCFMPA